MSKWFGKGCDFQCCQWEESELTGGPNYREAEPALIYCNHKKNPEASDAISRAIQMEESRQANFGI